MDTILEFTARRFSYILLDIVSGTLFYWLGWPLVKLISLGKYPHQPWSPATREAVYVSCVGLAIGLHGMIVALR